jgi:folate-binding protein YgfZ
VLPGWDKLTAWLKGAYPLAESAEGGACTIARHTGDPWAEYQALTRAAALVVTPELAPILVEGADATEYLHRRLAQDVKGLEIGRGAHALQLGGDGRLQADLLIYRGQESYMLLAPAERAAADATLVEQYTLNDDVTVDRFFESELMLKLGGPAAPSIIAALLEPKRTSEEIGNTSYLGYFSVLLAGVPCRIFRDSRWPWPMYALAVPPMGIEPLLRALDEACRAVGGRACGAEALRFARLKAGVVRWGEAVGEGRIPLEAHLQDGMHFNKGCYPGQEFIARIANLGHPAHSLVRWRLEGEFVGAGGTLTNDAGEPVGESVAAGTLPGAGETVGLAYLSWARRALTAARLYADNQGLTVQLSPLRSDAA